MLSPRWKKIIGDVRHAKGRLIMMIAAIAVGMIGVGTILSSYSILTREIESNYKSTNPASAYLQMDRIDSELLSILSADPNVEAFEPTAWVESRLEIAPNEWIPLLLFVSDRFEQMRLTKVHRESGQWPPADGTLLMERTSLTFIKGSIGDPAQIRLPGQPKRSLKISGTVHDPGLAPSWQEQTAYGYISSTTLELLGESHDSLNILKVLMRNKQNQQLDMSTLDAAVSDLAQSLTDRGYTIEEIRIPPLGKHPHQSQMTAILVMLLIFSMLALLLGSILIATMLGGLLAGQIRQIGVMKAIGAKTWQISGLYLLLVMIIGFIAVMIGVPLGVMAGRGFSRAVAELLNLAITSESIPLWNYSVLLAAGIVIPLLVASIPIRKATKITVREAITDYGTSRNAFGTGTIDRILSKIRGLDRTFILALRNTFRRKGRLLLTLTLLAAAGAMFLSSLNVKSGWDRVLSDAAANRRYDLEIRLHQPADKEQLLTLLQKIPGVRHAESWSLKPVAIQRPENVNIVRTYPDGGHGSFHIRLLPPGTKMVEHDLIEGRLLTAGDPDHAIVLNHMAAALFPGIHVGETVTLNLNGTSMPFNVTGIVRQNLTPSMAYVSPKGFADFTRIPQEQTNAIRVSLQDKNTLDDTSKVIESVLDKENVAVETIITESMLDNAVSGHVYILIFSLIFMAVLMAVVGGLGLMSTIGTNVIERTREFGIMRTIGGRSGTVMRNVIGEGLFIGLMSLVAAVIFSLPFSAIIGKVVGELAFRSPLPLIISPSGLLVWILVVIIGAAAASALPAWKASRLTIRNSIDYV